MQFTLAGLPALPDMPRLEAALADLDPSALVDVDRRSGVLRFSTLLDETDIARVLSAAGTAVMPNVIVRVPSQCCGGCSG